MIEACELTKYYGDRAALSDVSFFVGAGETVGFLGANGAGKSTTMRILTGFLAPTSGTARIAGHDVRKDGLAARRSFGYLPESNPLYRDMRVREFLTYRARLKDVPRAARRAAIEEAMRRCRLLPGPDADAEDVSHRMIGQLSKGYRQRVGLADSLLGQPPLLILDEPTVGLDPNQVMDARALIRELGRERTVFLSTHLLHEVELLCRRVIVIHEGRIVAEGETRELCERYAESRTLSLHVVAAEDPSEALGKVPGVLDVKESGAGADGARSYALRCSPKTDPRRDVAALLAEKGWLVREMRLEPVGLEDIFARLTRKEEA